MQGGMEAGRQGESRKAGELRRVPNLSTLRSRESGETNASCNDLEWKMGRMDVSFLANTRCGISGAGVCWSAASGSIAKENSRETNHWSDCDLCFVGGSFDAGAGSASGAHAGARSKEARIFYWNVEIGRASCR